MELLLMSPTFPTTLILFLFLATVSVPFQSSSWVNTLEIGSCICCRTYSLIFLYNDNRHQSLTNPIHIEDNCRTVKS